MADLLQHDVHHNPTNQGIVSVPYGPETGDDYASYPAAHTPENEKAIFAYLLRPDDSYTPEGVYWADLPWKQRFRFVSKVDNEEAKKELSSIGRMMKKDPLSPIGWYFRNAVLPGAGLGLEGYVLFSIGNLTPLFQAAWPACWKSFTTCNVQWVDAVTYLELIGILVGQAVVGVIGDGYVLISFYIASPRFPLFLASPRFPPLPPFSTLPSLLPPPSLTPSLASVAAGVSSRTPPSCSSVSAGSSPPGVPPSTAGSSATPGPSSSTVSVSGVSTP
jgi:hypothetical protein